MTQLERDLCIALLDLYDNMGGHNHWDAQGNHGATCPVCVEQRDARNRAREMINVARTMPKEWTK